MLLCFGSYAQVLQKCGHKALTNRLVVSSLVHIIDPNERYGETYKAASVSRLVNCRGSFPMTECSPSTPEGHQRPTSGSLTAVISRSRALETINITNAFQKNILPLLNEDKKIFVVHALFDIINKDNTIPLQHRLTFEKYMGCSLEEFTNGKEIQLDFFLAGLFLYTLAVGNNNSVEGQNTVKILKTENYWDNLKVGKYSIANARTNAQNSGEVPANLSEIHVAPKKHYITDIPKLRYILDNYKDNEEVECYPDRLYVLSLYFITLSTDQDYYAIFDFISYAPVLKNGRVNDVLWSVPYTLHSIDLKGRKVRSVGEIKNVYKDALEGLGETLGTLEKDLFYNLGIVYKEKDEGGKYIEYRRSVTEPEKMRCNYIREFFVKSVDSTGLLSLADPECLHQHRYLPFSLIDKLPTLDGFFRFMDKPIPLNTSEVLYHHESRSKLEKTAIKVTKEHLVYQLQGVLFKLALSNAYETFKSYDDKGCMHQLLSTLFEQAMMWGNVGHYVIDGNEIVGALPYSSMNITTMLERLFRELEKSFSIVCLRCTALTCEYNYGKTFDLASLRPGFSGKGYEKLLRMSHETHAIQRSMPKGFNGILFGMERNDDVKFIPSCSRLYKDYKDNIVNKSMQFTYIKY